jgi:hypothetical protein
MEMEMERSDINKELCTLVHNSTSAKWQPDFGAILQCQRPIRNNVNSIKN